MRRFQILILITLLESFAGALSGRGIYFYTREHLAFGNVANLCLSLTIGVAYILGAMLCHHMTRRAGERSVLMSVIGVQVVINIILACTPWPPGLFILNFILAMAIGMKWPVLESYLTAGLSPKGVSRALGSFNITWGLAVPLAIIASGYVIDLTQAGLFHLGAGISFASLLLCLKLERKPVHLSCDHPEKLAPAQHARYMQMCLGARWNLLSSYTLTFILAPLAPSIASNLGYTSALAGTALMSLMEIMRVTAFGWLQWRTGWHGRPSVILLAGTFVPIGFLMVLFGGSTPVVLAGQVAFGLACGAVYYAAIYYAMVTHNASVDAGGAHEALIGSGLALGPLVGLIGVALRKPMGGDMPGMIASLIPLIAGCYIMGMLPLIRMRKDTLQQQPSQHLPHD